MRYLLPLLFVGLTGCASDPASRLVGSWDTTADGDTYILRMFDDGTAVASIPENDEEYAGSWTKLPDDLVEFNFGDGDTNTPASAKLLSDTELLLLGPTGKALTLDRQRQ